MQRPLLRSVVALGASLFLLAGGLTAGATASSAASSTNDTSSAATSDGNRVTRRWWVETALLARYDPATRDVRVAYAAARTKAPGRKITGGVKLTWRTYPPVQQSRRTSYTCLIKRDATGRLRAGEPLRWNAEGRSYSMKYLLFPYTLDRARKVGSTVKRQIEFCVTGGGDVWNGFHQNTDGAAIAYADKVDRTLGTQWGTQVVKGAVRSTISLKVGAGPVSVGASTTVADEDRHTGSTGRSGDVGSWDAIEPYNVNRLNTYHKSGSTWRWQGSGDYQGNNGHLLIETNQRGAGAVGFFLVGALRAHCSHPFGIGCGDLD